LLVRDLNRNAAGPPRDAARDLVESGPESISVCRPERGSDENRQEDRSETPERRGGP
jgi:hypothetical protein